MLEIRLGGGLRLSVDGQDVAAPGARRAQALLAYLALHPGLHARSALAGRFWPDVLDESARASLRTALSEVRRALGPAAEHLVATRDRVGLDDHVWVDARAFAAARAAGDEDTALSLCAGELLTGLDDDWVLAARDEHARERGAALAAAAERTGDPERALAYARERVALDPLDEAAARALIQRLAAAGEPAAALRAYDALANRLRRDLQLAPSVETRAVVAAVRAGPARPPILARELATPIAFVGRDDPLRRIAAWWTAGDRGVLAVCGEPGIGKTATVLQFARGLDAHVLVGHCHPEGSAPFTEVLERVATERDIATLAGPDAPELGRLSAALGPQPDASGDRRRLFEAVDAVLSALAAERPVLVIVDDLQWAGAPAQELLAHVARSARPGRVKLLATGRRMPATLEAEVLLLPALTLAEVAALAGDARNAEDVLERSRGNPFYVVELLRDAGALPEGVRASIARRMAALGDAAEVVALVATLGVDASVLGTGEDVVAGLEAGLEAHLLVETALGVGFAHDLVREAVQASLSAPRRAALHRRAATLTAAAGRLDAAAAHLAHATPQPDDADLLAAAGRQAMVRLAYEDAARYFERALALRADGALHAAHGDALARAGARDASRSAFRAAASEARRAGDAELVARAALGHAGIGVVIAAPDAVTIALAEEALARDPAPATRARLLARLSVEHYYSARQRSEALSEEAVAEAERSGDTAALVYALNARRVALWRPDRLPERVATAERMRAVAQATGDREAELQAHNWLVVDAFERGDGPRWRAEVAAHEALADDLRLPAFRWYGALWRAIEAQLAGEPWRERLAAAIRLGEQAGDANAKLFDVIVAQNWHCADLQPHAGDIVWLERQVRESPAAAAYTSGWGWVLAGMGRLAEAREVLSRVVADDFAMVTFDTNWISAMGEAAETSLLLDGTPFAAEIEAQLAPYADLNIVAGRAVSCIGSAKRLLGRLAVVQGHVAEGAALLRAAVDADDAFGAPLWAAHSRIHVTELTGDPEPAREALAFAERCGATRLAAAAAAALR